MGKLTDFLKEKKLGFYFSVGIALLAIITAIVYALCYGQSGLVANLSSMSWLGFVFLLVGVALGLALYFLKRYNWVPVALALFNFLALLGFIYKIYTYVSVVATSIDLGGFNAEFISCVILFSLLTVVSIANLFIKQTADEQNNVNAKGKAGGRYV